ncbi:vascular cell adhesion protein 1-like [Bufo bufo]|uniref:vascular cell adhesion protein 1-like n=1 Tax=Bufo bufo TaxID=8384 RepID=UPI001ABE1223|nr:vascular cell adhesion protein 1-like [Bufo bufo]
MKACQVLLSLFTVILLNQVRSQDTLEFGAISSEVFVPFGEAVWLNCSTHKPDQTIYESRLYKNQTKRGPNWLAVQVIVRDWENSTCVCMLDTRNYIFTSHTIVMAYALPSDITIDLQTELQEGKEYTINCMVHEVAPLEYLTINIIRGGDVIDSKSYKGPHVVNRRTVSRLHTFTAHLSDNLMKFSCEAILQLGSELHTVKSTEITVQTYSMSPLSASRCVQERNGYVNFKIVRSQDTMEFGAISSEVFVPFGEAVWLNCSTHKPDQTIYESRLYKNQTKRGPNWLAVQVIVNDWENSTCVCMLNTRDEILTSHTIVMSYALPSDVTIDLQTELQEGKEYTINCTVHEVAPLEYLTINISRGEDVIDGKSYEGPHVVNRRTVSHLHTFTACRSDNLKDFSCEAILRLGSEVHTVKSTEITVQSYTLPSDITIDLQTELQERKEYIINCTVHEVAPLGYLTIYSTDQNRGGDVIDTKSYEGPHVVNRRTVSHLHTFTARRSDNFMTFSCEAILRLGSEVHTVKSTEKTVQTYMRSQDMLGFGATSSELFVSLGEAVWLNCSTPKPDRTFYDTRLYKKKTERGPNWLAVQAIVRDWENSTCVCVLDSGDIFLTSQTIVMAYEGLPYHTRTAECLTAYGRILKHCSGLYIVTGFAGVTSALCKTLMSKPGRFRFSSGRNK